ncbi:MAG: glycosyl transferase [Rhodoferax sp.]|nr:glycosyl transferase [Rhodoferax sp.]
MIGVVVPAHDEEVHISDCLRSLAVAAQCPRLAGEEVRVVVVLDSCADATADIARRMGAITLAVDARNVGIARARGAELALNGGARWLAFTDADSVVGPGWIAEQLALQSDAVCGTIEVRDWGEWGLRGAHMQRHFEATYTDADGHRHIHGANLGVSAAAYRGVGGFRALASSEDVALVDALRESGASIAWSAAPRVVTSARRRYRAPEGFGATLQRVALAQGQALVAALVPAAGVATS